MSLSFRTSPLQNLNLIKLACDIPLSVFAPESRPCALSCQPAGHAFYVTLARTVKDGTRCSPDGGSDRDDHVCAAGMCKVGFPRCGVTPDAHCGRGKELEKEVSAIYAETHSVFSTVVMESISSNRRHICVQGPAV